MPILDGTRDHQALHEHLRKRVSEGAIVLSRDGQPLTDQQGTSESLERALERSLDKFAKAALYVA